MFNYRQHVRFHLDPAEGQDRGFGALGVAMVTIANPRGRPLSRSTGRLTSATLP